MTATMKSGFFIFMVFGFTLAKNDNAFTRLIDDLFDDAGYEKDAIPMLKPADKTSNVNAINVGVGMSIISMDYDPAEVLTANTWMKFTWTDYRLKWDANQYEGISNIKIPASRLWRPDLSVYNAYTFGSGSFEDHFAVAPTNAIVYSSGKILWIPPLPLKVNCQHDKVVPSTNQNDPQECNIKIGSWTYDGFHMNLTAYDGEEYMELSDMTKNSPYVVTSQEGDAIKNKFYDCCEEPYMSVDFRFTVQKAFDIVDGEKVFNKSPEELEELFELYKNTFKHVEKN
eukprot:TRINITY_DN522_c0_g1_i6.p1 TRINITY_DN522_c0_g1~~TRINITY_DN522_c0_g1_i6.p1  ORF type:complete len:284 (+),score=87.04 TRINITY_DN522_c0_g1_i6:132-983(+)